jgi:hypothetical protein
VAQRRADPGVLIAVELGRSARRIATDQVLGVLERRVADGCSSLMRDLGLPGKAHVQARLGDGPRTVRVTVKDALIGYPQHLAQRIWLATAPASARKMVPAKLLSETSAERWLDAFLNTVSAEGRVATTFTDYLARLCVEIVRRQPAKLIHDGLGAAYRLNDSPIADRPSAEYIEAALRSLFELGMSAADPAAVLGVLRAGEADGQSAQDSAEVLFALTHEDVPQVLLHPSHLHELLPTLSDGESISLDDSRVPNDARDVFRSVAEWFWQSTGFRLPVLRLTPTQDMRVGAVALKVNALIGAPLLAPRKDQLLASGPRARLLQFDLPVAAMLSHGQPTEHAIIGAGDRYSAERLGLTCRTPLESVAVVLSEEILRAAPRLFSVEDLESGLAELHTTFPSLIEGVLALESLGGVTRVLRGLLDEGVSIRDLRLVLEALMQFETVSVRGSTQAVFDERLPVAEGTPVEVAQGWANRLAFVRRRLKNQLSHKYTQGGNVLRAIVVDPQLETLVEGSIAGGTREPSLTALEQELLCDSVRRSMTDEVGSVPLVLTTTGVRLHIRKLLAAELPDAAVAAYAELRPDIRIETVGSVGLESRIPVD